MYTCTVTAPQVVPGSIARWTDCTKVTREHVRASLLHGQRDRSLRPYPKLGNVTSLFSRLLGVIMNNAIVGQLMAFSLAADFELETPSCLLQNKPQVVDATIIIIVLVTRFHYANLKVGFLIILSTS